ncbi:MAG TPA: ammonium transporter [Cyanobacteria bacterium UBA8156]|jgi:Amt family ammonium transporter|nr:ammonium transporter [Cyanobacteria bacterium UBA8156]
MKRKRGYALLLGTLGCWGGVAISPALAQDVASTTSLDGIWVLLSGFFVFFMQTGFAMLEAGLVRQTGAINCLLENFIDAGVTALVFWAVGFGLAFGNSLGGILGTDGFFLGGALQVGTTGSVIYRLGMAGIDSSLPTFVLFFFHFAFAATASTIVTGAMAERTHFVGDLVYSVVMGAIIYPLVAHWVWNKGGWLAQLGFRDFAGSAVVHAVGGITALVGAAFLGPRAKRVWDALPPGHNMSLATLGAMILWFGWYGFNAGSTLTAQNPGLLGLIVTNTTLAAGAGAVSSLVYVFQRIRTWHLFVSLNGSIAGLVAITAGCAYVMPWAAVLVGAIAGVLVIVSADFIESQRIDDPVGAFSVHGACGIFGTVAVGLLAVPALTGGNGGLLTSGNPSLLLVQLLGIGAIALFATLAATILFGWLKAQNLLRVSAEADELGIDAVEHGASVWPDVYKPQ